MGKFDGRVALVTGAARGQGRSHAIRLAEEGADLVVVDACTDHPTVPYPLATKDDLDETVREVQDRGRRITATVGDTRDYALMEAVVADALEEYGRLDIIVANAGVGSFANVWEMTPEAWSEVIDINLTGVFNTVRPALPTLMERGPGASIVLTSSTAGLAALPNLAHYTAAKHGITGLMRSLATELAPYGVRANSVHPTVVDTPMVQNPAMWEVFGADTQAAADPGFRSLNALPIPHVDPIDVSEAVVFLASDEARYITGTALTVDAGSTMPYRIPPQPAA